MSTSVKSPVEAAAAASKRLYNDLERDFGAAGVRGAKESAKDLGFTGDFGVLVQEAKAMPEGQAFGKLVELQSELRSIPSKIISSLKNRARLGDAKAIRQLSSLEKKSSRKKSAASKKSDSAKSAAQSLGSFRASRSAASVPASSGMSLALDMKKIEDERKKIEADFRDRYRDMKARHKAEASALKAKHKSEAKGKSLSRDEKERMLKDLDELVEEQKSEESAMAAERYRLDKEKEKEKAGLKSSVVNDFEDKNLKIKYRVTKLMNGKYRAQILETGSVYVEEDGPNVPQIFGRGYYKKGGKSLPNGKSLSMRLFDSEQKAVRAVKSLITDAFEYYLEQGLPDLYSRKKGKKKTSGQRPRVRKSGSGETKQKETPDQSRDREAQGRRERMREERSGGNIGRSSSRRERIDIFDRKGKKKLGRFSIRILEIVRPGKKTTYKASIPRPKDNIMVRGIAPSGEKSPAMYDDEENGLDGMFFPDPTAARKRAANIIRKRFRWHDQNKIRVAYLNPGDPPSEKASMAEQIIEKFKTSQSEKFSDAAEKHEEFGLEKLTDAAESDDILDPGNIESMLKSIVNFAKAEVYYGLSGDSDAKKKAKKKRSGVEGRISSHVNKVIKEFRPEKEPVDAEFDVFEMKPRPKAIGSGKKGAKNKIARRV